MARLIRHEATGPVEVKPNTQSVWICQCGLSQNPPFCDGAHKIARQQEADGKLYRYENDQAVEIPES